MIARALIRTLALLLYAACSAAAVLTPPDIPEQPLIRTIYEWGDRIAVIAYRWLPAEKRSLQELSVVDESTSRVVPIHVPGCDVFHDVAYGAGLGKLLMCGSGKSAHVYRLAGASWTAVSEPLQGTGFRFAVDGSASRSCPKAPFPDVRLFERRAGKHAGPDRDAEGRIAVRVAA
jgi:hypothetical protein